MPILPPKQQQKVGHRLWGYLLVCGAIGFYIAGAPLWLVIPCVAVGTAIMLIRPQKRVEEAGESAATPPSHAPLGLPDARPIEPAPLLSAGVLFALVIAIAIVGFAWTRSRHTPGGIAALLPWTLVSATATAPEPLADGDVVLIYRWQTARDAGQFTLVPPEPGGRLPRLAVLAAGDADSLAEARDLVVPPEPVLVADARPDSTGAVPLRLLGRGDLHGVGVGVVWPLARRQSLP